jgi:hypothetical protein
MSRYLISIFLFVSATYAPALAQFSPSFYTVGKLGIHSDIPNEQVSFGGGLGFGINLSSQPNRWQGQVNLDYFSLNTEEVTRNGFRRFSMMLQLGRIWSIKLNENVNLGIGGGVVGVLPLESKENPSFQQNALPAAGFYIRFEYPVSMGQDRYMYLVMDNSVFGDGFMRNVFGLSIPIRKTKF